VPSKLAGTALPFAYNDLDGVAAIVRERGQDLAAVVMEPTRSVDPNPGFLEGVRQLCDRSGAVLVFDEITAGWRLALGGAHLRYGVEPDVAVFAKALGNGHPMAAIIGRARVMEAAQEAAQFVRGGRGPYFLEFRTYRFRAHSMFDAELYRSKTEVERWKQHCPIAGFVKRATAAGWLAAGDSEAIEAEVAREVERAVAFAEAGTWEPVAELTRDVYTARSPS